MVQRGVDVERDPGHRRFCTVRRMPKLIASKARPGHALARAPRRRRLRRHRHARLARDRLAPAPAPDRDRRAQRELRGLRRGARPGSSRSCSSTGSAAAGRTGSRTSRASAASGRRAIGIDLPGFGFSEMPREEISISGYGRVRERAVRRARPRRGRARRATRWAASSRRETAIQFPERVARLVLVSAAGITTSGPAPAGRSSRAPAWWRRVGTRTAAMSRAGRAAAATCGTPLYQLVHPPPDADPAELLYEITSGAGRPGFLRRAAARSWTTTSATACRRSAARR